MEKLELRARARAAARASGLFEIGHQMTLDARSEARARSSGKAHSLPLKVDLIDEVQARAACRPMGELEYIVQAADGIGKQHSFYVIVPDPALKAQYQRLGFTIEPGCRVLLDAAALLPLAVLRLSSRIGEGMPERGAAPAGFNPYFDLPPA